MIEESEFHQALQLLLDLPPFAGGSGAIGISHTTSSDTLNTEYSSSSSSSGKSILPEEDRDSFSSLDLQCRSNKYEDNSCDVNIEQDSESKKRKLASLIKSIAPMMSIKTQRYGLPLNAPSRFINAFITSYNSHDMDQYKQQFLSMCTHDFTIITRVYGQPDPITGKVKNPMGDFSYLEIKGVPQVVYMAERFFEAAPDGIFEVKSQRSCNTNKATVFMCSFNFRGTLIEETPSTELSSAALLGDEDNTMVQGNEIEDIPIVRRGILRTKPVKSLGSMAMYINEDGRPYCLEFFYEFQ